MKSLISLTVVLLCGTAMAQLTTPSAPKDATPPSPAENRTPFAALDTDHNGRLSPAEAASVVAAFAVADKDGNGSLDPSEYMQYLQDATTPSGRTPGSTPKTPAP